MSDQQPKRRPVSSVGFRNNPFDVWDAKRKRWVRGELSDEWERQEIQRQQERSVKNGGAS